MKYIRVKAINYDIELFDLELGGAFSFQGIVKIQVNIKSATNSITLNAHQLKIHEGEISGKPWFLEGSKHCDGILF